MKRIKLIVGLLLCFFTLGLSAREVVKIGVILPLSGDVASFGEEALEGVDILREKYEKNGEVSFDYRFIIEDGQMTSRVVAAAARKLIDVDKVDVIVPNFSAPTNAVKPFAQRAGVVMVGSATSDESVADYKLCFTNAAKVEKQAVLLLETLQKLDMTRLGIFTVQQQACSVISEYLHKHAADYGVEIVCEDNFPFGTRDFRTQWMKVKQAQPDIVMVAAFNPELRIMLRQKAELAYDAPITNIEFLHGNGAMPELDGVWWIGSGVDSFKNGAVAGLRKDAADKCNYIYAVCMHDSIALPIAAYEEFAKSHDGRKPTAQELAAVMRSIEYTGMLGRLDVDEQGVIDSQAGYWLMDDGEARPTDFDEIKALMGRGNMGE